MRTISKFINLALALCLAVSAAARAEENTFAQEAEAFFAQQEQASAQPTSTAQPDANELTVAYLASSGAQVNPLYCNERDLISLNQLVFESVVTLDQTQKPVPELADNWTVQDNVWTFNLRQGVQFHNGMECLAQDVVASYEAFVAAGENNPYCGRLELIESMTAVDAFTLQVTARFPGLITLYAMTFPVMERSTLADAMPRGTGPYWYISYTPDSQLRLESNPLWWKLQPNIQAVTAKCYFTTAEALEALQTGAVDCFSTRSYSAAFNRKLSSLIATDYSTSSYELLVPNLSSSSALSNVLVRQAVMYAIDRATLVSNAYLDMAQQSEVPIIPGTWLYESRSAMYYYSPERALQLLNQAGWQDLTGDTVLNRLDANGMLEDLQIIIVTYDDGLSNVRQNAAEQIAANLTAVGVRASAFSYSRSDIADVISNGDFDLLLMGVNLSEVPNLVPMFAKDGSINIAGTHTDEMDQILLRTLSATTEEEMILAYSDLQMYIVERLPIMGIGFRTGCLLSSRSLAGLSGAREYDVFNGLEFVN